MKNKIGYKERVKDGDLSAMNALVEMEMKAKKRSGKIGLAVLKQSAAFQWLKRRAVKESFRNDTTKEA